MARPKGKSNQPLLPGLTELRGGGRIIPLSGSQIPHLKILAAFDCSADGSGGLVETYRSRVIPGRTRTIHLLGRKSSPRIAETLLGYEVQAGYKRVHCPDKVTARYLVIFTEIGCRSVRLPYDPTLTAELLPALEGSLARLKASIAALFPGNRKLQVYVLRKVYAVLRVLLRQAARTGKSTAEAEMQSQGSDLWDTEEHR
jgi:hypothetical protein